MKSRPPVMRPALLAGLFASIILVSCGRSEPKADEKIKPQSAQEKLAAEMRALDSATTARLELFMPEFLEKIQPACPQVCLTEHQSLTAASNTSFYVRKPDDTYDPLTPQTVELPWSHFRLRVMGNYPTDGRARGVVFCFGLDNNLEFKLGINVVLLKKIADNEWSYDSLKKATMYVVEGGQMEPISRGSWFTKYGKNYKDLVHVRKSDGTYRGLTECDHLEYIMPWETEMMLLGEHNKDIATSAAIRFNLAAEQVACVHDPLDVELRQFIMGHLEGALSDDPTPNGEGIFHRRATDLGTPCPPRCGKFVVTAQAHCSTRQNCL